MYMYMYKPMSFSPVRPKVFVRSSKPKDHKSVFLPMCAAGGSSDWGEGQRFYVLNFYVPFLLPEDKRKVRDCQNWAVPWQNGLLSYLHFQGAGGCSWWILVAMPFPLKSFFVGSTCRKIIPGPGIPPLTPDVTQKSSRPLSTDWTAQNRAVAHSSFTTLVRRNRAICS